MNELLSTEVELPLSSKINLSSSETFKPIYAIILDKLIEIKSK